MIHVLNSELNTSQTATQTTCCTNCLFSCLCVSNRQQLSESLYMPLRFRVVQLKRHIQLLHRNQLIIIWMAGRILYTRPMGHGGPCMAKKRVGQMTVLRYTTSAVTVRSKFPFTAGSWFKPAAMTKFVSPPVREPNGVGDNRPITRLYSNSILNKR